MNGSYEHNLWLAFVSQWRYSVWLVIAVTLVAGCQSKVDQVAVNGTITYDDEPIEDGQIAFEPQEAGKMQFGIIANGKYKVPREFGLKPGKYLVRITASRATGEVAQSDSFLTEDTPRTINEQFIPAKYNTGSELLVDIEPVGETTKDFSLSSK